MYHAIKHRPESLEENVRTFAALLGAKIQAAIYRAFCDMLHYREQQMKAHLFNSSFVPMQLIFLMSAFLECPTHSSLVERLLLTWAQASIARKSGNLTPELQAAADVAELICDMGGLVLKTH